MSTRTKLFVILAACLAILILGCGSDSSDSATSSDSVSAEEGSSTAGEEALFTAAPGSKIDVPKGAPPKKLVIKELKRGPGATAKSGDEVEVIYVAAVYSTGKVFSVAGPAAPFKLKLGSGEGVPGLEKGVVGMKVGGRRQLIVPPALGYSDEVPSVPHNSTFVFLVGLVGID
jgi:peptidylprolyl isomerase